MEPEAKYTLVGASVLILLALLAGAIVWLKSSGEGVNAHRYKIYFQRQSLEGLEPRSYVTMRGIRVGSVTGFRFSSRRPGAVEVFISVDPGTPVRESTGATIDQNIVTGIASVRLNNSTEQSPLLERSPPDEPYPVIAEGESRTQQVAETVSQLAAHAGETLERLNEVLSPENRAALAETLANLRRASRRAEGTLARVDAAADSLGGAADEVRRLAATVAADARTLTARYDKLGDDAGASARELGDAVRKMSADVERLTRRADALLARSNDELRTTSDAVRSAADSVGSAAGRLRDPRQILYGPAEGGLGPGEGRR